MSGIGVPIMLAYVYGVVPISLCRGGGCGVSRGKGRGVRIDFDEDDGPITGENEKDVNMSCAVEQQGVQITPQSTIKSILCLILQWQTRGEP